MDYNIPTLDIGNILTTIYLFFVGGEGNNKEELIEGAREFYDGFSLVSICVSFIILVGIVYSIIRLYQIRKRENQEIHEVAQRASLMTETKGEIVLPGKRKWQQVEIHAASPNAHERRLAILEADIILDDLVYEYFSQFGDTLGERLKQVDRSDFQTLDKAWEAHRIRNSIAHEGSSFELSERELRNILKLYEEVFKEFKYI